MWPHRCRSASPCPARWLRYKKVTVPPGVPAVEVTVAVRVTLVAISSAGGRAQCGGGRRPGHRERAVDNGDGVVGLGPVTAGTIG